MPREDFFRVLDSLAPHIDPADFAVVITGGEPLMCADLEECGREIKKRGYPWGMVTNGLGLTPERYTRLLNAGLKSLTISLDGLEENHNLFRGNPHSFERAVRAINMAAHTDGITFDVMTCVNRKNLKELPSIFNLLLNLGVKRWRVSNVFPKGRAKDNPLFMLSNDEFRQVFEFIREAKSKKLMNVNYDCEGFLGSYEHVVSSTASVLIDLALIQGSCDFNLLPFLVFRLKLDILGFVTEFFLDRLPV